MDVDLSFSISIRDQKLSNPGRIEDGLGKFKAMERDEAWNFTIQIPNGGKSSNMKVIPLKML
jgi:hypothetical protein